MLPLKNASKSRPSGQWQEDDYDAFEGERHIGRIMWTHAAPKERPWFWTITASAAVAVRSRLCCDTRGSDEGVPHCMGLPRVDKRFTLIHAAGMLDRHCGCFPRWSYGMISGTDISALYLELTNALTEVLAENSVGPARRGRLARARAAVKKHPNYSEHEYFLAVETAFAQWEAIQNAGR